MDGDDRLSALCVIQFNATPVISGAGAPGSGIFLHSWLDGPTEGCVALPEARLLQVLRWLRPSAHPVIEIGTDDSAQPSPAIHAQPLANHERISETGD